MVSINEIPPAKLIEEAAKELKKMPEMAPPEWAAFVKTGVFNERPPADKDWWYTRAAAILRSIYLLGPIGVSKLRTKYGGRKNRGHAPDKTFKAGGNIIRKILQKFELVGFIKQTQVDAHKGRVLTPKGKSFMDKISVKLYKDLNAEKKTVKANEMKEKAFEEEKAIAKEEKPKKAKKAPEESKEEVSEEKAVAKEEKPKAEKPAKKAPEEKKVEAEVVEEPKEEEASVETEEDEESK